MTTGRVAAHASGDLDTLYRAWLLRHNLPNAYARWRAADRARAPVLAFTAVACEPLLLDRLGHTGTSLASQAEKIAVELLGPVAATAEARATAQVVQTRILNWRARAKAKRPPSTPLPGPEEHATAATAPLTLEDHLRIALKDYPHFRESTARALFQHALQLGAAKLEVVAPYDQPFMLAVARYAGRGSRRHVTGPAPPQEDCATAVSLVQDWAVRTNSNPFLIDFSAVTGSVHDLVLALSRDVAGCLSMASRAPGGVAAPGFGIWEDAEEFLAFAVVSLRPSQLRNMDMDGARIFASAAARLATAAVEDASVQVPVFAEALDAAGPKSVLASTRFALPNGIEPRRSVRALVSP